MGAEVNSILNGSGHHKGMERKRIIIVGGGFGGVKCAKRLLRDLPRGTVEIVLFNRENHLVFSPLLADAVGSSVNAMDVIVPLRQLLPGVYCRTQGVLNVLPEQNEIEYEGVEGGTARMSYHHLVLACGSAANLNVVPGMADHSFALKNLADAAALRTHVIEQMEKAEVTSDPERRAWHLTFIIVGGGYSGVEAAGEINDLVRSSARYFHNFQASDVRVILIHSREQLLPEIGSNLREFARVKMEEAGVTILLNKRVSMATPEGVGMQGGEFVHGGTIVCTVGNSPDPMIQRLNVPKEKGRLLTEPDMRVKGFSNLWALGDCAQIINAYDNQPSPATGQFAERQGTQCAANICRVLHKEPTEPFRFKPLGQLCSIGGHSAVAEMFGVQLSGFWAWFAWRSVYLFKLPTWARRLQLMFDWAWLLWFPRDLSHVRTDQTERVSHAHYEPGNYIYRQGDPANFFYIIEDGEVEVSRTTERDPKGEVLAVLGPGSFFGERALLGSQPRVASARARTVVNLTIMGREVFAQVSKALGPLSEALGQALNRRTLDVWKDQPKAYEILKTTSVTTLMDPVPQPVLKPSATLREVSQAFVDHTNEFFYVSRDGQTLEGIVTMTDLTRAWTNGAQGTTQLAEVMAKNPVALSIEDNCATVSNALREYRLKSMPIVEHKETRKLVGCIRARKVMGHVLKKIQPEIARAQAGNLQLR
jgi:NADH:ubiquinone reductase (H+-translocating)